MFEKWIHFLIHFENIQVIESIRKWIHFLLLSNTWIFSTWNNSFLLWKNVYHRHSEREVEPHPPKLRRIIRKIRKREENGEKFKLTPRRNFFTRIEIKNVFSKGFLKIWGSAPRAPEKTIIEIFFVKTYPQIRLLTSMQ